MRTSSMLCLALSLRSSRIVRGFSSSSSPKQRIFLFNPLPYNSCEVHFPKKINNNNNDDTDTNDAFFQNDSKFFQVMESSIQFWKENNFTSTWIHVPQNRASLIEKLTSEKYNYNFDLHHINTKDQTIALKKWLRPEYEDKIPPYATHQVGCAGFVLSEENEILLVKEWRGPLGKRSPSKQWKLPGGLLDAGESLEEASCREVMEETGVDTEYQSTLTFWHRHNLTFGKSDFYFVCLLKPLNKKEIKIDPVEISDAVWMPVEEFLRTQDHPLILHVLKHVYQLDKDNIMIKQQKIDKNNGTKRIQPICELVSGGVQWPNREPYPTYTPRVTRGTNKNN